jgi:MoxR-like ATPase
VVLTSNRTRELHDALKRRCLYHWIDYPDAEREVEIVTLRQPGVARELARRVVAAVNRLRELELAKPPGVAETIDWARTLDLLGERDLSTDAADLTLGSVLKEREDLELAREHLDEITRVVSPTPPTRPVIAGSVREPARSGASAPNW